MANNRKLEQAIKKKKTVYIYRDLEKAFARLQEAVKKPPTVFNQDATIKRFEFTFELSWKLMKNVAQMQGLIVKSPKNAMRQAAVIGLIDNPVEWFDFIDARNYTVHTYNEGIAQYVYKSAKKFIPFVEKLLEKAKNSL